VASPERQAEKGYSQFWKLVGDIAAVGIAAFVVLEVVNQLIPNNLFEPLQKILK